MRQIFMSWTHGTNCLVLVYLLVLIPMWVVLYRARSPVFRTLRAPMVAVPATIVGMIVDTLLLHFLAPFRMGDDSMFTLLFSCAVFTAVGYLFGKSMVRESDSDDSHQRGAVVWRPNRVPVPSRTRRSVSRSSTPHCDQPITLAGMPIEPDDETKHFKFIGTTGTGKSTAIREMLSAALARGDRAVIADPDGGYLRHFYNAARGDVILNPFYPDAAKWHLLGEIKNDYDVDQLARSLIPDVAGGDKIWTGYSRTIDLPKR